MGIFEKLGKILSGSSQSTDRVLNLYVQCNKCGEKLRARVDKWNELSPDFEEKSENAASYHCRKVLMGENLCFQPIELQLKFDKNHKLVEKQITGGKYIDEAEFKR